MSNLTTHAEKELRLAGLFDEDSDYGGMLADAVMELIKVFSKQGHSGFSAKRTLQLFTKVADYDCLLPLTGKNEEWNDVPGDAFQNNRVSSVFKEKSKGRVYFLDAIIWKEQSNSCFTGEVDGITSRQYIKSFPFSPKTFYIDVTGWETKPGWWEHEIVNKEQLDEVWEYYDKKEP